MGDFTEYWEDFPEEDPGNYVGGRFDPAGARALRAQSSKIAQDQANLDDEISRIIQKVKIAQDQAKRDAEKS
jgi:hypothetical protein